MPILVIWQENSGVLKFPPKNLQGLQRLKLISSPFSLLGKKIQEFTSSHKNLQGLPRLKLRNMDFAKPCFLHSPRSVLPLWVHIQARWSWNAYFGRIRAVWGFQKSISRNHVCCTLHSRFCPFGFILKPIGPKTQILDELGVILVFKNWFREAVFLALPMVDFAPSGSW